MASSIVSAIVIARMLGAADMGRCALALSVSAAIVSVTECGIGATLVRYGALAHSRGDMLWLRRIVGWASTWRLAIVLACAAVALSVARWLAVVVWHDETLTSLILLAGVAAIPLALTSLPIAFYSATRAFGRRALVESLWKCATLMAVALVAALGVWTATALMASYVAVSGVLAGLITMIAWRDMRHIATEPARRMFRLSFPLGDSSRAASPAEATIDAPAHFFRHQVLLSILATMSDQIDLWMVGSMLGSVDTGLYAVAKRFAIPFQLFNAALATAIYPRMAGVVEERDARLLLARSLRWLTILGVVGLVGAATLPLLAPMLFGHEFVGAIGAAQLLCARYCLALVYTPLYYAAVTRGLIGRVWMVQLAQLVFLVAVNYVGIPQWGLMAPAVALLAREALGVAFLAVLLGPRLGSNKG